MNLYLFFYEIQRNLMQTKEKYNLKKWHLRRNNNIIIIWGFTLSLSSLCVEDYFHNWPAIRENLGKEKKMIRINPQNRSFIDQK